MKKLKMIVSVILALVMATSALTLAFADDDVTADGNDDKESATAITSADGVKGAIASMTDVDFYSFEITEEGIYNAVLTRAATEVVQNCFKVSVIKADDTVAASADIKGNQAKALSSDFYAKAGKYFVKVTSAEVLDSAEYTISVQKAAYKFIETEPNNDKSGATQITLAGNQKQFTEPYYGVAEYGDTDFYKFSTDAKGFVQIKLYNSSPVNIDLRAAVFNAKDNLIAVFDLASNQEETVSSDIPVEKSTYYVKIEAAGSLTGGYSVAVSMTADDVGEKDFNDTIAAAESLTRGKTIAGAINYKEDVDFYRIDSSRDISVSIKCDKADGRNNTDATWTVALCDEIGNPTETQTLTYSGEVKFDFTQKDSGVYYIKITAGTNYTDGNYFITGNEEEQVPEPQSFWEQFKALLKQFWGSSGFQELVETLFRSENVAGAFISAIKSIIGVLSGLSK
jgi:hypothetical protein